MRLDKIVVTIVMIGVDHYPVKCDGEMKERAPELAAQGISRLH